MPSPLFRPLLLAQDQQAAEDTHTEEAAAAVVVAADEEAQEEAAALEFDLRCSQAALSECSLGCAALRRELAAKEAEIAMLQGVISQQSAAWIAPGQGACELTVVGLDDSCSDVSWPAGGVHRLQSYHTAAALSDACAVPAHLCHPPVLAAPP